MYQGYVFNHYSLIITVSITYKVFFLRLGVPQTMTPEQRAQYLPVMQALLKVLETGNLTTFKVEKN